jgi:hypothetical protein
VFNLSLYALALLVHVVGGCMLIGSTLSTPLIRRSILAAPTLGLVRTWLDFARRAGRLNPAAAFAVLGTGIYLGSAGFWTQGWFWVALAAWLANTLLAVLVVDRTASALAAAAGSREGAIDAPVDAIRRSRAWELAEPVMRANDLGMLYVMFVKPSAIECVLVLAGAIALSIGADRRASRALKASAAAPLPAPAADAGLASAAPTSEA